MKIVADDKIPFLRGVLEEYAEVVYLPGDHISKSSLNAADALLTRSITSCDNSLLENTPVRFVGTATIGDDHIDKDYFKAHGIEWATAKGCNADAVAQFTIGAILTVAERLNIKLLGSTLGVIGVGNIGSKVKKAAEILGMQVLCYDPPRKRSEGSDMFISLSEIQQAADFVTIHVPLTREGLDKTVHLVNESFLSGFSKEIVLVNTSRGGVVEQDSLKRALDAGRVKAVVLDVWENEPQVDLEMIKRADFATPHIAGYSMEGKAMGTAMTIRSLSKFFNMGLDAWHPKIDLNDVALELSCGELTGQELLSQVFGTVCPLQRDSDRLKNAPNEFEELRRNYTFRRENSGYVLQLKNCNSEVSRQLRGLGFQIKIS